MPDLIELFAAEQDLTMYSAPISLVSESQEIYTVAFDFDVSWDDYTDHCYAVFKCNKCDPVQVDLVNGQCYIPGECLIPGTVLKIGVYGINGSVVHPTVWMDYPRMTLPGAGPSNAPKPPSPNYYDEIKTIANEAKEVAQSVRDDADAGEFTLTPLYSTIVMPVNAVGDLYTASAYTFLSRTPIEGEIFSAIDKDSNYCIWKVIDVFAVSVSKCELIAKQSIKGDSNLPQIFTTEIAPNIDLNMVQSQEYGCAYAILGEGYASKLTSGVDYYVLFDEVIYRCLAFDGSADGFVYIGDQGFAQSGQWSGEFSFVVRTDESGTIEVFYDITEDDHEITFHIWTSSQEGMVVGVYNGQYALIALPLGGYYTPAVSQPEAGKIQVDFTPSEAEMPAVDPVTVDLMQYVDDAVTTAINKAFAEIGIAEEGEY